MRSKRANIVLSGVLSCVFAGAGFRAVAEPAVKLSDMPVAIELANTSFKQCLTQARLQNSGAVAVTESDLDAAKGADELGQSALIAQLSGNYIPQAAPASPSASLGMLASLFSGDQSTSLAQQTPQGLKFTLGLGYANDVQSWLQPLNQGNPQKAAALLAYEAPTKTLYSRKFRKDPTKLDDAALAKTVGVLGLVERATVSLSLGDLECAANFLDNSLERSDRQQNSFWGSELEGYEHIMAMNMKAMAYLLAGDERARNMAQASRELQGLVREQYAEQIEKRNLEAEQSSAENGLPNQQVWLQAFNDAYNLSALQSNSEIASRVATPYVNPLADYLSAVVAETEAFAGTGTMDEWSRASIAWRNASTLAPGSAFLDSASKQTDTWQLKGAPTGMKVVNVLLGVGAAPTTAVASTYFDVDGKPFPVMIPVKVPQKTGISENSEARISDKVAAFELVSDIEGMVMRKAEDERSAEMLSALVRGWIAYQAGEAAGANSGSLLGSVLGGALRDTLAEPVTTSWSSLPRSYYAARLIVPVSETQVRVSVPGAGTQTFQLNAEQATFVYATAKDNNLWGMAQSAPFGGGRLEFQAQ